MKKIDLSAKNIKDKIESVEDSIKPSKAKRFKNKLKKIWKKKWIKVILILLLLLLAIAGYVGVITKQTVSLLLETKDNAIGIVQGLEEKNLQLSRESIDSSRESLNEAHSSFNKTKFIQYTPLLIIFNNY